MRGPRQLNCPARTVEKLAKTFFGRGGLQIPSWHYHSCKRLCSRDISTPIPGGTQASEIQ